MKRSLFAVCALALLYCSGWAPAQDNPPATQPAPGTTGKVERRTLSGYHYIFTKTQTTAPRVTDAIMQLMPQLDAAMRAGTIVPRGPVVFVYRGATMEPDKEFTLEVGVVVADDAQAPDGFESRREPAFDCVAMLYTGPYAGIPQAWMKMMGEMAALEVKPTADNVGRELYLYYDGPQSPNNVTWLAIDVE